MNNAFCFRLPMVGLFVVVGMMLQSCALHTFQAPPSDQMHQWSSEGRLAVRHDEKSQTANFKWDYRSQNDYSVKLFGPLGTYANQLIKTPRVAQLITGDGEVVEAESLESLSERVLGLRLPVQSMTWWARGRPDPTQVIKQRAQTADGLEFQQIGWNVRVVYPSETPGGAWPHKVVLTQQQKRAVLVFHKWTTLDSGVVKPY